MVPGGPQVLPGGSLVVLGSKMNVSEMVFLAPLAPREGVWGAPTSIIVRNLTPSGARQARKVLWGDNLTPFSSNKIRAKILDLGYGGARRALHNLCPKSARILSAAITRTILLPAGVRGSRDVFHSGVG